ncbi:unnamed protein product [Protopolystoma xenopodis]|uniref:Uncharacterized protein n=1 Tax=Protopolystoma xenopodis TaxID=117903 RepID=A0A3S5ACC8_9PLAT|nr:unnamed protein product [Protopolystoma xenopodis]
MSTLLSGVGRTWVALRADDPKNQPELSRAVKPLLDSLVIRLATLGSNIQRQRICASVTQNKSSGIAGPPGPISPLLSPNMRAQLNSNVFFPLLACIDPWALGQSRLGLKPLSARELLRQLINSYLAENQASAAGAEIPLPKLLRQHLNVFNSQLPKNVSQPRTGTESGYQTTPFSLYIPLVKPALAGTSRLASIKRKFRQISQS